MITLLQNMQGILGVLVGGGITYYANLKLSEKKYLNDKKNKIFENNFNILQEMKLNNLEIAFLINNNRGYELKDSNKSSVEKNQEFIASIPVYSFNNLKLAYKLIGLKKEGEDLLNLVNCLHNKMIEIQEKIVSGSLSKNILVETRELFSEVNKNIEIVTHKMANN